MAPCMMTMLLIAMATLAQGQWYPQPMFDCRCISHQFTTAMGLIGGSMANGQPLPIDGSQMLVYDYDRKMMAIKMHSLNAATGQYVNSTILEDYNRSTMKQYVTTEDGCFYKTLTGSMTNPCLRANATFRGTVTFGSGQNSLKADVYNFSMPAEDGSRIHGQAAITENCTPVAMGQYGNLPNFNGLTELTELTYFFANFQPSIADTSVFTAPTGCKPMDNQAIGRRSIPFL